MWLFIGTFAVAFLAALMLVWLDDRIAETDCPWRWTLTSVPPALAAKGCAPSLRGAQQSHYREAASRSTAVSNPASDTVE